MPTTKEHLVGMFSKVMAGTVTREEGAMFLNFLARDNPSETARELGDLISNPPAGMSAKTILHTAAISRNRAFIAILVANLDSADEGIASLSAEELAGLRSAESRNALIEHLGNESDYTRRACATALLRFDDGVDILKRHILTHPDPLCRRTSVSVLVEAGKKGVECLLDVLNSDNSGAVASSAQALVKSDLSDGDMARVFQALINAGDRGGDPCVITDLLKIAASLGRKAKGYEEYIMAFSDHPSEEVRNEASRTLIEIRA